MSRILACIPFFLPRSRLLSVMWRMPNRANPDAIDIDRRTLWRERVASPLSARQFALMHALFERPDTILSRAQLADRI